MRACVAADALEQLLADWASSGDAPARGSGWRGAAETLQIGVHHHLDELLEVDLRRPSSSSFFALEQSPSR